MTASQGLGGCHGLHHEEGLGYLVQIPMGLQRVPLDGGLGGVGVFTVEGRDWSSQLLSVEESRFQWPILDNDDRQVVAAQKLTLRYVTGSKQICLDSARRDSAQLEHYLFYIQFIFLHFIIYQ